VVCLLPRELFAIALLFRVDEGAIALPIDEQQDYPPSLGEVTHLLASVIGCPRCEDHVLLSSKPLGDTKYLAASRAQV
jgi:hypothetical protein